MNKFLLLALAAFALSTAVPAIADDATVSTETVVETTVDADAVCHDADGAEIVCADDHADMHDGENHDADVDAEVGADVDVSVE